MISCDLQKKKSGKHRRGSCLAGIIFLLLAFGGSAAGKGGKLEEYSAQQVTVKDGKAEPTGMIRVAPGKIRIEHAPSGKEKIVVILRQDLKLTTTLFPERGKYLEAPLDEQALKDQIGIMPGMLPGMNSQSVSAKQESLGTETVNGYLCEKKKLTTSFEIMGQNIASESIFWISDKFDFPLRIQTNFGGTTEIRDINPGKQDPGLFEIPAGFTKAATIMEALMSPRQTAGEEGKAGGGLEPPEKLPPNLPPQVREFFEQMRKQQRQ